MDEEDLERGTDTDIDDGHEATQAEDRHPFLIFLRDQAHSGQSPQNATTEVIDSAVMPLLGLSTSRSKSTNPSFQPSGSPNGPGGDIRQALPSNIEVFR